MLYAVLDKEQTSLLGLEGGSLCFALGALFVAADDAVAAQTDFAQDRVHVLLELRDYVRVLQKQHSRVTLTLSLRVVARQTLLLVR